MARGWLVAFEGIDGAGTTSQLQPVAQGLATHGFDVVQTHEPSTGEFGRQLRHHLKLPSDSPEAASEGALALLFAADRLDHLHRTIAPALQRGAVVLCDRYVWSSLAYQSAALSARWVEQINAQAPPADINVYFALPQATAEARRQARGGSAERFEHSERQLLAAARYETLAKQCLPDALLRIDATQALGDVTGQLVDALRKRLPGSRSLAP